MDRLGAMEVFVRIVDTGSFSIAARQLRLSQPSASKAIAQLEKRLGVRLLVRSTHGLALTEAGANFYRHAKRSIEAADEADLSASGTESTLVGRLRISAPVTFWRLHVAPRFGEFLAAHPSLDVDVILDDRYVDLIGIGADVALRIGNLVDSTLTARRLGQARRLVVGTPDYFAKAGEPKMPSDLLDHYAVIHDTRSGGTTWDFRRGNAEMSVTLQRRLSITAAEGVRESVLHGDGLAITSEWIFLPELASGGVKAVLQDWTLPPLDLWAVYPVGRQINAKVRAFVKFVENLLPAAVRSAGLAITARLGV